MGVAQGVAANVRSRDEQDAVDVVADRQGVWNGEHRGRVDQDELVAVAELGHQRWENGVQAEQRGRAIERGARRKEGQAFDPWSAGAGARATASSRRYREGCR